MKKSYFLICSVAALCLCACNKNKPEEKDQGPAYNPTMEVSFEKIADTCMVPSYVKEYIDAMHEQEDRISYRDRVDSLFCNMTWEEAAKEGDQEDGVEYDDDHSGGVDVCQMLRNTMSYENKPIEIKWDDEYPNAKIVAWSKEDKSDLREFPAEADGKSAKLDNLFRATKYYYQLVDGENASQMKNFVSGDYHRMITMGNISNVRDIGGNTTSYGVRTNQGLIYRGGEMAVEAFSDGGNRHSANWSDAAQKVQKEVMNIGLELDLRTKSGSGSMTESPLEWEGEWEALNYNPALVNVTNNGNGVDGKYRAQYVRSAINSFDSFITDPNRSGESDNAGRNLVKEIFEYYAQADKQHVYFHCWGGADRTGVTGFLLNAILGVSYTDAIIDFELTTLTNNKRCHMHNSRNAHMPKFLNLFVTGYDFDKDGTNDYVFDENATLRVNADNLLMAMGVEQETLEKIRGIMLPGYAEGKLTENERINKGSK